MKIGFLTDNYHTEVLDFLFELFSDADQYEMILYNDHDNYNNWKIYENRYKNLSRRKISKFIGDLHENYCDKIFLVTYENLFALRVFDEYKDKIIVICHNETSLKDSVVGKYDHITLTPMFLMNYYSLNYNWMFPIVKNHQTIDEISKDVSDKKKLNGPERIKIMTIGAFDENNKDIAKVHELLQHDDIELHIFLMTVSGIVKELDKKYDNVFVREKISTESILQYIQKFGIQYVLYIPKQDSEFLLKGRWSGCISFAYSNNIPLILPKSIADNNKFLGCVTYENGKDSLYKNLIDYHNSDTENKTKDIWNFKRKNWERNILMRDTLLKLNGIFNAFTNFGIVCLEDKSKTEIISNREYISGNVLEYLYKNTNETDKKIQEKSEKTQEKSEKKQLVININSEYGVENFMINSVNKTVEILSIERDIQKCKLQKSSILLNFYNNIRVFHSKISNINEPDEIDVDKITLDSLLKNMDINLDNYEEIVIHVNESDLEENKIILHGSRRLIKKYKPTFIFYKGINYDNLFKKYIQYKFYELDNRIICKFDE